MTANGTSAEYVLAAQLRHDGYRYRCRVTDSAAAPQTEISEEILLMVVSSLTGECGSEGGNVIWTLDSSGILTISGTGEMADYINQPPWLIHSAAFTSVVIQPGVTSIGAGAFMDCAGLTSVMIPDTVTSIGMRAFRGCGSLTDITIPDSVVSIGSEAFRSCAGLADPDGFVFFKGILFDYCGSDSDVDIPAGVTGIGDGVFMNRTEMTSVMIPDGVTSIGDGAFYGCTGLTSVMMADSVTGIGYGAFMDCSGLAQVFFGGDESAWTAISVAQGNEPLLNAQIEFSAIIARPLCILSQPSSVSVFVGAQAEFHVTVSEGTAPYTYQWQVSKNGGGSWTNVLSASGKTADFAFTAKTTHNGYMYHCVITDAAGVVLVSEAAALATAQPPTGGACGAEGANVTWTLDGSGTLTVSGTGAMIDFNDEFPPWYDYREFVTAIRVQPGVTHIGKYSFVVCKATDVTIGEGVTDIGNYAFGLCTELTGVTIPGSVTRIGEGAFVSCDSLTDVYYTGTESMWNAISIDFDNNQALAYASLHCLGPVAPAVAITADLTDYVGPVGSTASFTVQAEGAGLTYQWWVKSRTATRFSKSSVVSATYSVTLTEANSGRQLYCVVTDAAGNTAQTNTVSMTVGETPAALAIITDLTDYYGPEGSTASFTVVASGEGLTYQWYVKKPTASKFSKSSITGDTYSVELTAARNGNQVYCVVTDAGGNTVQTGTVTMTIREAVSVEELEDYVGAQGSTATFTAIATGEGLTYQWWVKKPSATKFSKSSITGDTYAVELTAERNGNQVYCVVTDAFGNTVQTNTVSMIIGSPLSVAELTDYTGPENSTATFTVSAEGEGLTYQWYVKKPSATKFSKSSITG
ncbi:MAG: leucine-rich repeat protein, partial [Oscillospiraceae bacterium]|nr:leucine-rich repeat protein [Oscillospiraceae bacterium]